jgi:reductive dehalogenase
MSEGPGNDREPIVLPVLPNFQRFSQRDDIFNRANWDETVRSEKSERFFRSYGDPSGDVRPVDGFTQRDYALRNAAWHVSDIFTGLKEDEDRREGFLDTFTLQEPPADAKVAVDDTAATTREFKRVAALFGADLIGVTDYDERWVYSHRYSRKQGTAKPADLPTDLPNVIVIAKKMDQSLIATVPSALSGAATGLGYSQDAAVLLALAQYIQDLGYRAVPSQNDTALSIPYAIKAGLGEYARNGLLITKEFGPRVRISKIFTDLPLDHDSPRSLGVQAFCNGCRKCADACPPKAIAFGSPSSEVHNQSNIQGVVKWTTDAERCFGFWANQNAECSICIRGCPYNRDFTKVGNRVWLRLASTQLRRLMLAINNWLGADKRKAPSWWWSKSS